MANSKKVKGGKKQIKDLTAKDAKAVVGGRAGDTKHEYLVVKLSDVIVTSVTPSGNNS
jgi:hypothetical protein